MLGDESILNDTIGSNYGQKGMITTQIPQESVQTVMKKAPLTKQIPKIALNFTKWKL